jgi:YD repeat-containing protein
LGRRKTVAQNSITTTLTYNDADQVLTEANQHITQGGMLDEITVSRTYDSQSRPAGVAVLNGPNTLHPVGYGYDNAGRLQTVTSGNNSATYAYTPNSALIATVTFKKSGTPQLTTTKTYDKLNRLAKISSSSSAAVTSAFGYQYNQANQRARADLADGTHWGRSSPASVTGRMARRWPASNTSTPSTTLATGRSRRWVGTQVAAGCGRRRTHRTY